MSERPSAEQMERIRILNAHILKIGAESTVDQHVTMLLTELDAVTRERDHYGDVVNKLTFRLSDVMKERDEARREASDKLQYAQNNYDLYLAAAAERDDARDRLAAMATRVWHQTASNE